MSIENQIPTQKDNVTMFATACFDEHYKIVYANEKFCHLLGYTQTELFNMTLEDFMSIIHPNDRQHIMERLGELNVSTVDEIREQREYIRKDGTVISVIKTSKISRNTEGYRIVDIVTLEEI